ERRKPSGEVSQNSTKPDGLRRSASMKDVKSVPSARQEPLRPAFVSQWKRHLERTVDDPNTPFPEWRELLTTLSKTDGTKGTEGTNAAQQLLSLAEKTGADLAEVVTAWKQLKVTEAGKAATELPDARQELLRKLLFNTAEGSPFAVPKNAEDYFSAETKTALQSRRDEIKQLNAAMPKLPEAMAVSEGTVEDLPLHLRGNHTTLGKERLPRRYPRILAGDQQTPIAGDRSGRLEFAQWLTQPNSVAGGLTARVAVNRIWQGHFGEGLVRSPDNFGLLGDRPTHPALLDWLSRRFIGFGWSRKSLHREIMLSSAYQMRTTFNEAAFLADPDNRLWWRRNRRRLEVEAVRDSLLAVSGRLENGMGGSLLPTANRAYVTGTANFFPQIYNSNRRSVYLPVVRSALYELFQVFDFAEPSVLNGKRDSTTLATQALFMLNSPLVAEQAREVAQQLLARPDLDDVARIRLAFLTCYQREPLSSERNRCLDFLDRLEAAQPAGAADRRLAAWRGLCRTLLAANEFLFVE
ncbi:MAG: DUF1553 domain-containing protein, partial [Planctomycetaceae bacterium]